jgi:hypothetical protein
MFTTPGFCDWCHSQSLLSRHEYLDGKHHYSCEQCHDLAKLDVKLFNQGELEQKKREAKSSI